MIGSSRAVRVWAYRRPTDLRKGFNGLYGLVVTELDRDPLSGDIFLFVNRRKTTCKALLFDGTGLCIFQKRLEKGQFAQLWGDGHATTLQMTQSELSLFIEGCALVGSQPLSPPPVNVGSFV